MKHLLLIDGDELVYKACFASQKKEYIIKRDGEKVHQARSKADAIEFIGNDLEDRFEIEPIDIIHEPTTALWSLYTLLNTILEDNTPYDEYTIYLNGPDNFRFSVATILPYKGNRSETVKPFYYEQIRGVLENEYNAKIVSGIESDDALSIQQWNLLNNSKWETTIVSQDKDLRMVPGYHYNPTTRERFYQSPADARLSFFKQLLIGDSTDNIPGIYRMGEKTAQKLLEPLRGVPEQELITFCIKQYSIALSNPKLTNKMEGERNPVKRITEVGRLLWMLQERGQLWCPDETYYENKFS